MCGFGERAWGEGVYGSRTRLPRSRPPDDGGARGLTLLLLEVDVPRVAQHELVRGTARVCEALWDVADAAREPGLPAGTSAMSSLAIIEVVADSASSR